MRTRTTLAAAAVLAVSALLGWLAASNRLTPALAQDKTEQPTKEPARGEGRAKDGKRPNIVFVLMDNLGYGEPGVYGGGITRGAPTPWIDRRAGEGTRLTNFNVEAQCTWGFR
jgi:hypothetical protein